jgi:hypothetical protein
MKNTMPLDKRPWIAALTPTNLRNLNLHSPNAEVNEKSMKTTTTSCVGEKRF